MQEPILIHRGEGFGDRLMAVTLVAILRDNGIEATFWCDVDAERAEFHSLIDSVMIGNLRIERKWGFRYENEDRSNILRQAIKNLAIKYADVTDFMKVTRGRTPIRFKDDASIGNVDVSLCLKASKWTLYKDWPFAGELLNALERVGIRCRDLSGGGFKNQRAVNALMKAKMYVGVDTGPTHLAAAEVSPGCPVQRNGIILQSGYNLTETWDNGYGFDVLSFPVPCAPCNLRDGCCHEHRCMTRITVTQVRDAILRKLEVL